MQEAAPKNVRFVRCMVIVWLAGMCCRFDHLLLVLIRRGGQERCLLLHKQGVQLPYEGSVLCIVGPDRRESVKGEGRAARNICAAFYPEHTSTSFQARTADVVTLRNCRLRLPLVLFKTFEMLLGIARGVQHTMK